MALAPALLFAKAGANTISEGACFCSFWPIADLVHAYGA
jgi:hypothetical protein